MKSFCALLLAISFATPSAKALEERAIEELFSVFRGDPGTSHNEGGVVIINTRDEWDQILNSLGNLKSNPVDFDTHSVLVVTGQYLGVFCRKSTITKLVSVKPGTYKITVTETYPEQCSGNAVCLCSMVAGAPPPAGNTVTAIQVEKPVTKAEVKTVSAIEKCCSSSR